MSKIRTVDNHGYIFEADDLDQLGKNPERPPPAPPVVVATVSPEERERNRLLAQP